jgi:hypothetical protein
MSRLLTVIGRGYLAKSHFEKKLKIIFSFF